MRIVMLGGSSSSTFIAFSYINKHVDIEALFLEDKIPAIDLIKRRIKRFGIKTVFNQLLFQTIVVKILKVISKRRINEILYQNDLKKKCIPENKLIRIRSVNDDEVVEALTKISPDLIIVNGTRIISKKVLKAIPCIFINMHVGITPGYRGVHGAYWALVNNDKAHAGVTIHYIDEGIDTGKVIAQDTISITAKDNFVTYPYLQIAKGLPLIIEAIKAIKNGERPSSIPLVTFSKLWSHPTLSEYIKNWLTKGIK